MARDRILFVAYLAALVAISLVQDLRWLAGCALAVALLAGPSAPRLLKRAVLATLFFAGSVSAAWIVASALAGDVPWRAIARLDLRVLTLTLLTFTVAGRLDFEAMTSFSPRLQTLTVLIIAQVKVYRRLLTEFRLAGRSRMARRPAVRDSLKLGAAVGASFLIRAEQSAEELTQGMTSRGFFLADGGESEPRP